MELPRNITLTPGPASWDAGQGGKGATAASAKYPMNDQDECNDDGSREGHDGPPRMLDLFSGPRAPLATAFRMCGWEATAVDLLIDPADDVSKPECQRRVARLIEESHFVSAAFDCSTKTRVREIPLTFDDGRPAPKPMRSADYPDGLPGLSARAESKVHADNCAAEMVLEELNKHARNGGASIRENPDRSYHWQTSAEVKAMETGLWWDKRYSACVLQGARCKGQRLRHNVREVSEWPTMGCHHLHAKDEWRPSKDGGVMYFPSKEEAEYTAALAFYIAATMSAWAVRRGFARLRVCRLPPVETTGDRRPWLAMDPRATREWAMAPMAATLGAAIAMEGAAVRISVAAMGLRTEGGKAATLPKGHI